MRTTKEFGNFEMVVEWMHEKAAGNSGVFVWTTPASIEKLTAAGKPGLPDGIEVQILDHGFTDMMKAKGAKTDWFGTHGDVFPVGVKMTPFPPLSPDGSRSFPRKHLAKGHGEWNHYYIRAINGEVRLWVNGEEVSGGTAFEPARVSSAWKAKARRSSSASCACGSCRDGMSEMCPNEFRPHDVTAPHGGRDHAGTCMPWPP